LSGQEDTDGLQVPKFSANLTMMFAERPLLERFAAARAAGFAAVEIQFPYDTPLNALFHAKEAAGVAVDLINLPAGDFSTGVRGIAGLPDPARAAEFRAGVARGREYARALGARKVNVLAGILPEGGKRQACLAQLVESVRFAADAVNGDGIRVLIEPINSHDIPGFLVNRTTEALAIAEEAAAGTARDIAVQADLYHMARMGEDIPAALKHLGRHLGHIQFSDVPGRVEPGSGTLDWPRLFAAIDAAGYTGFSAAEYRPTMRTEDTLAWMRDAP
jgi:hydroxypyruvate isomerase